jgi:ubiquinone/menaquinone biosynthesis C-methylase UbiE
MAFKKISIERWKIAQNSEEEFWNRFGTDELSHKKYSKKAKILSKKWSKFIKINKNTKILQIGCGPLDLINYLGDMKKYSLDPLADYYMKQFKVDYKKANLVKGVGEDLPFEDEFFDIVLLPNVLDHTVNPEKVLSEVNRVLKKDGIFYFDVYFYQREFLLLAKIWELSKKATNKVFNPAHPYMFTLKEVKHLLSRNFSIFFEETGRDIGEYENIEELKQRRKKQKLTKRLPASFGLLGEVNYTAICKKRK